MYTTFYVIVLYLIIKILSKTNIKKIYIIGSYIKDNSAIGFLFIALIENNIQYLTFIIFSQIRIPAQYYFTDKVKLVITVLILFIVFFYSIAGYLLIMRFKNKISTQIFLHNK